MKGILLSIALTLLAAFSISAQNQVTLTINHLLDGESLSFEKAFTNNLDDELYYNRLQYPQPPFILHPCQNPQSDTDTNTPSK